MIRKAKIADAKDIQNIINEFAKQNLMLPRSLNEIYENIRDFWVKEADKKIIGCSALHIIGWDNLAEIKSLAVVNKKQDRGIGKSLVTKCLQEAKQIGVKEVFVLTYRPKFFASFGFKAVGKNKLPHKIWAECINCQHFPGCDETALAKLL